ncbi:3815_t:CDS:1 [Cetraspora pellucida]|uniref:3815_t:CDS:1 n=1 Tax=Cetraspora pellucida TaxID=1433469 RepID=A0A9N9GFY6_9GLOM|nr:3815_t:CDS:1 [Cetraspora pellucida]
MQKSNQTNFKANFSHMLVDMLRFLYYKLGIAKADFKQYLVNQLVNKSKKKKVVSKTNIEKIKMLSSSNSIIIFMFDNASSLFFELVVGSASSPVDVRSEKRK